jgi:hypothetical protein
MLNSTGPHSAHATAASDTQGLAFDQGAAANLFAFSSGSRPRRIVVAMSGGVDSSVVAGLAALMAAAGVQTVEDLGPAIERSGQRRQPKTGGSGGHAKKRGE